MAKLVVLLLAFGLATAANIRDNNRVGNRRADENMHLNINARGQIDQEDIELNFRQKYVKIQTDSTIFIHDYKKDQTMVKINGRCFMVDQYEGIPSSLNVWKEYKALVGNTVQNVAEHEYDVDQVYKALPYPLNRTVLPEVMQEECAEINILILQETYEGDEAIQKIQEAQQDPNKSLGSIYLPMFAPALSGGKRRLLRFDGDMNVDLNEFQTNLVPFPRLHFITTA